MLTLAGVGVYIENVLTARLEDGAVTVIDDAQGVFGFFNHNSDSVFGIIEGFEEISRIILLFVFVVDVIVIVFFGIIPHLVGVLVGTQRVGGVVIKEIDSQIFGIQ